MTITDVCICFEIRSGREEDIYTYTAPALCGARLGCARERQSAVVQLVYSVYTGSGHVTDPDGSMSYRC